MSGTTTPVRMHLDCIAPPELYCSPELPVPATPTRNLFASINLPAGMSFSHENDCIAVDVVDNIGCSNLRVFRQTQPLATGRLYYYRHNYETIKNDCCCECEWPTNRTNGTILSPISFESLNLRRSAHSQQRAQMCRIRTPFV